MFVEVVYETGRTSVMSVESKEEALAGIAEQHRRAKNGEKSLASDPSSPPAERITKAFFYDEHPNEFNTSDTLTADELDSAIKELVTNLADENGVVPVGVLASQVRGLTHPMIDGAGPHESKFYMESTGELSTAEIDKAANAIGSGS